MQGDCVLCVRAQECENVDQARNALAPISALLLVDILMLSGGCTNFYLLKKYSTFALKSDACFFFSCGNYREETKKTGACDNQCVAGVLHRRAATTQLRYTYSLAQCIWRRTLQHVTADFPPCDYKSRSGVSGASCLGPGRAAKPGKGRGRSRKTAPPSTSPPLAAPALVNGKRYLSSI